MSIATSEDHTKILGIPCLTYFPVVYTFICNENEIIAKVIFVGFNTNIFIIDFFYFIFSITYVFRRVKL